MKRFAWILSLMVVSALLMVTPLAFAGATSSFAVSADVLASCNITASTFVDFGNIDVDTSLGVGGNGSPGSVTVQCEPGTAAKIGLNDGLHAVTGQRKIAFSANTIDYNLFQDNSRLLAWKNTDPDRLAFTGDGTSQVFNVYGKMNYSVRVPVGHYSDTVQATVTF